MTSKTDPSTADDDSVPSLSYLCSPILPPSFESDFAFSTSSLSWSHAPSDDTETKSLDLVRSHSLSSVLQPPIDFQSFIDSYKFIDPRNDDLDVASPPLSLASHWRVCGVGSSSPNTSNSSVDIQQTALAVSASIFCSNDELSGLPDISLPPMASSGMRAPSETAIKNSPSSSPPSPNTSLTVDSWPSPSSTLSTTSALAARDLSPLPIPLIPLTDLGIPFQARSLHPIALSRSVTSGSTSSSDGSVPSYSKAPVERKAPRYHHVGPTQSHANDFLDIPYTLRNPTPSRPRFRVTLLQFPVDVPSNTVSISVTLHSNKPSAPVVSLSVLKDHLPQLNVALPPDFKFDAKSQYRMSVSVTRRGDHGPFWSHSISVPLRGKLRPHPYDM